MRPARLLLTAAPNAGPRREGLSAPDPSSWKAPAPAASPSRVGTVCGPHFEQRRLS